MAIDEFEPEIIIPFCDRSVEHLHHLHACCNVEGEPDRRVRVLIERSLGPAESFATSSSRYDLLALAADEGIRVPETIRIDTDEDLRRWKRKLPWLLKADGTWGGRGVRKADSLPSGSIALLQLTTRATLLELVKQLLLNRDRDWIISNWQRKRPQVVAQSLIEGRPANCAVVCWQGEVLASFAVEVVQAVGQWQPATVVQIVEGREMIHAAKRIADRLRLSGFFGLDFMIEHGTGATYLIEMNPRCTPPCYLPLGEGRDLVAAIWGKLADRVVHHRQAVTEKSRIAYFPQSLPGIGASSESLGLDSAYLDVPDAQPELIHELLHPWPERSLAGRLLDRLRSRITVKQPTPAHFFEVAQQENLEPAINQK
ncbi:MAG: ATP-grasp domain-containing protein [Terracidiphilus sp.]